MYLLQITDLVRDSPLRDLRVVLSLCAHVVVPRDDSFEYDPKEEFHIEKEKDGDSDESDEDYVPEGGSGGLGESDEEGGEIQKEGVGKIQKEGVGEIQTEGVGKIHKKGVGKIQKKGVGEIQKEGWLKFRKRGQVKFRKRGWVKSRKGVGEIQKEAEGSGMGKGMRGKGKGLSGAGRGCKRMFSYTVTKMSCSEGSMQKSGPQISWGAHKNKDTAQEQPLCRRNGRTY